MGSRGVFWRRLVVGAAVVSLLFMGSVGCGDEPEAGSLDDGSASREDTGGGNDGDNDDAGKEESPPDEDSDEGAGSEQEDPTNYESAEEMPDDVLQAEVEQFVGEFFEEMEKAADTGDTARARELTTEDCGPCWNPLDSIDESYSADNSVDWDGFDEGVEVSVEEVHGNQIETQVSGSFDELRVVDEEGSEVRSFDPADFIYYFGIDRDENGDYIIQQGQNRT